MPCLKCIRLVYRKLLSDVEKLYILTLLFVIILLSRMW